MAKRVWITVTLLLIAVGITAGVGFRAERNRQEAKQEAARLRESGPTLIVRGAGTQPEELRRL